MTNVWRTLLLIALCVQMASVALASYAQYTPHEHQHCHLEDVVSHDVHLTPSLNQEASSELTEFGFHKPHCAAFHFAVLLQTQLSAPTVALGQVFNLSSVAIYPTDLFASIERPKWVTI